MEQKSGNLEEYLALARNREASSKALTPGEPGVGTDPTMQQLLASQQQTQPSDASSLLQQQLALQQEQQRLLQQQLLAMNAPGTGDPSNQASSQNRLASGAAGMAQGIPGGGLADNAGIQGDRNQALQQMLQLRNIPAPMGAEGMQGSLGASGFGQFGGGGGGMSNNDLLLQLLQQQQQQALSAGALNFGSFGAVDNLALERQLLLRQQQEQLQASDALLAKAGLAGHSQLDGGLQGGGNLQETNQFLLQLLQQQQQQQNQAAMFQQNSALDISLGSGNIPMSALGRLQTGELLSSMAAPSVNLPSEGPKALKKKSYRKKDKDKPKRPLSAYNFFFKEERARIVGKAEEESKDKDKEEAEGEASSENKEDAKDSGLQRKGRSRPHGKISFEDLGRLISQRWQELKPDEVEYYKKKSDEDRKRYQKEMDEYRKKKAGN